MSYKGIGLAAAFFTLVCLSGLLGLDRIVAEAVAHHVEWSIWSVGTDWLEVLFGFPISKWATGFVLLLAAGVFFAVRRSRVARALAFIAIVQLGTRLTVGVLKGILPRERPFEVLDAGVWHSPWLQGHGSSFPSGHAAHFWGLLLPVAILSPRLALWLLPLPLFVSAARVAVNDHYLSDVAASGAIAAGLSLLALAVVRSRKRSVVAT
jgi:membrane-associated phospholipid phosphatase